ncbi:hypothetical protein D3C85_1347890 [compost metagenome]
MFFKNFNLIFCKSRKFTFLKSISIFFLNFLNERIKNFLLNFKFSHTLSCCEDIFNVSTFINVCFIDYCQFREVKSNFVKFSFFCISIHKLDFIFFFKFKELFISFLIKKSINSFHIKISIFNDGMSTMDFTINFFT